MKPAWSNLGVFLGTALLASAQTPAPKKSAAPLTKPAQVFEKYCFECHGDSKPEAGISLKRLVADSSVGPNADHWEKVAEMIETAEMPPSDAEVLPSDAERKTAATWIRQNLKAYEKEHAGEPGRVTVRRLTSGEYAYTIRDLTGFDIPVGIDASSDSVGGEGFTNYGDVQFVQDASIERYLEAAKQVADHAVVGAGPLQFYSDAGKTGMELSALARINELYTGKGFRVVSGEGGRPFGLERYGKVLFVAWYYQHRVALGDPKATLRDLAVKEGITGRFADHVWSAVNRPKLSFPSQEFVTRWKAIAAPAANAQAAMEKARRECDELASYMTTWPSWFFARGDVAAGGAGDESPLMFDDTSLAVQPTFKYAYAFGAARGGRGARAAAPAPAPGEPTKVYLSFTNLNPSPGVKPVVILRNARIIARAAPTVIRGAPPIAATDEAGAGVLPVAGATPGGGGVGRGGGRRGRGNGGAVVSTQALRTLLSPEMVTRLGFGTSPDGSAMAPDDFAVTETTSFELAPLPAGSSLEVEAELGTDRNAVVRLVISDRLTGPPARGAQARVFLGDAASAGYKAFRAGIAEYVSLFPPNSHGEANPADKDPVPAPFDNTYNSPEHDAFVLKVKYQRTDKFFTDNLVDGPDRARLNQAWNDLFSSWPYHDAYLGMLADHFDLKLKSRRMQDMEATQIAALPQEVRPHVVALRAHYDEVMKAQKLAEPGQLEDALAFASRAWRRPLTKPEITRLKDFYQHSRTANGLDHDDAIRALLSRVLVSPQFLYRVETVAAKAERQLNDWEMASRLSFFLWSSIPDDELRRAATAGELTKPASLAKQVKRMTADPKARRLATEFFGQWLGFYHFDEFRGVDTTRFPEFTEAVKKAMYEESVSTFEYLVRQQRPLKEMLYADYTFLNQPLAKFYGITQDVKTTDALVKVDGANAFNRGGALRLGSVLTTTSAPLRTSPVKRGDWLLRRILGTPTPPPPADAGSLPGDPKAFGGLTLRARLDEHKRNPACANCHLRIDPLGFPLEEFDAVGRTRKTYDDGVAVDVTGEFADKKTIVGTEGLLGYLQGKNDQVTKTLSKKMLGYALGRTVLASDRALLDEMVAAGGNATFADLATKIVTSRQFRNRQGQDDISVVSQTKATSDIARLNQPAE